MKLGRRQTCLGSATLFASSVGMKRAHAADCSAFATRTLEIMLWHDRALTEAAS